MTLFHVHFLLRNQQAFQRLLDANINDKSKLTGRSHSGGKSWTKSSSPLTEINARDALGRTILHLAAAASDGLEYTRLLLRHPSIDINAQDTESRWTALHRALYNGNIPAAVLLLQRPEIDFTLRDTEGFTAFDLYNSTVEGSSPSSAFESGELFTWGTNRNAALGVGDGDDRQHPEQILLRAKDSVSQLPLSKRFAPLPVKRVSMSKLHTAVVTADERANIHVCGFGSGGRLGPGQHTQYALTSLQQAPNNVERVALGQDHTLLLTKQGEVFSFGLNRFSQLGYVIEPVSGPRSDELIQPIPKKVVGPLKKEHVKGVAASRCASACWTRDSLFTWGLNNGQLGYDKSAQPVQVLPRKVSKIARAVLDVCLSDSTLVCLLETKEVFCIYNDRAIKIIFPSNMFPSEIQPYRPPQAMKTTEISGITNCEDSFACLSSSGELFTFYAPAVSEESTSSKAFKPQRVSVLKRPFSGIKDVAVGSDGTLIVCTQSGHVFVRARSSSSRASSGGGSSAAGKGFKFNRLPYLQRVVKVAANTTGSFAALRLECKFLPIEIVGDTLADALATVRPFWDHTGAESPGELSHSPGGDEDEDGYDTSEGIHEDMQALRHICQILQSRNNHWKDQLWLPYDADVLLQHSSDAAFAAHKFILSSRSSVLLSLLSNHNGFSIQDSETKLQLRLVIGARWMTINVRGCHPMSLLIFLNYLYTDSLLAIWDRRVSNPLLPDFRRIGSEPNQIKQELQAFARVLRLKALSDALSSASKRIAVPTIVRDVSAFHSKRPGASVVTHDVLLEFSDANVPCYSIVLRSRSSFFSSFFDHKDWTMKRRNNDKVITVNMKHREWRVMSFVVRFLCAGEDDVFEGTLDFVLSVEELLELMFDVISAANELLLDRLILICSSIILEHTNLGNVCYVLSEATHYHAVALVESVQTYMAANMETLLESQIIDVLEPAILRQLGRFVRQKQIEKNTFSREKLVRQALEANKDWIALQDFAVPIVPSERPINRKGSVNSLKSPRKSPAPTPLQSISKTSNVVHGDDLFSMDDLEATLPPSTPPPTASPLTMSPVTSPTRNPSRPTGWKSISATKVDMRTVLAETEASTQPPHNISGGSRTPLVQPVYKPPQRSPAAFPGVKVVEQRPSGSNSSWAVPGKPVPVSLGAPVSSPSHTAGSSRPTPPRAPSAPQTPGLGPVYSPARQPQARPSPLPTQRRVSSTGKAWGPSPQPSTPPTTQADGMSFVAIQELQREQETPQVKDKRSLKEIQEEEQAQQQEEEFLRWWAAEEERVRQENEATAALIAQGGVGDDSGQSSSSRRKGHPRGQKKGGVRKSTKSAGGTGK